MGPSHRIPIPKEALGDLGVRAHTEVARVHSGCLQEGPQLGPGKGVMATEAWEVKWPEVQFQ